MTPAISCLPGLALALACAAASAAQSAPAAKDAIDASTNAVLQGDSVSALQALRAVPASDYSRADADYRACMLGRFDRAAPPYLAGGVEDPFAHDVLRTYQDYWWRALAAPTRRDVLAVQLEQRLRALLGASAATAADMDALEALLAKELERRGFHALLGWTMPLRELMVWRKQDTRRVNVALPEGQHTVEVEYLDDFISRGWSFYGRCERGSAGGWATDRKLSAVVPAYRKDGGLESEAFQVVFLGHETQHFADQNRFPGMASWELEYRAKLVELIQGETVSAKRLRGFITAQGDDPDSPHTYANKRLVADLRAKLGAEPAAVPRPRLQTAARELLREDTQRRVWTQDSARSAQDSAGVSDTSRATAPCTSTPEAQGMDSNVLSRGFRDIGVDGKGLHSLLVSRHGCLVIEAYWPGHDRGRKHYLNSATKAVLAALVGIAVQDGSLREDDLVASWFPGDASFDTDPRKRRIRIRHLLTMSSGIDWRQSAPDNTSDEMGRSSDWVRFILDRPMAAEPGSVTNYSNGDSHLLAAVLQKATGMTALDFAHRRLFARLGIDDVAWDSDPQGRSIGSAALQMRPIDMAKLGTLHLRDGVWGAARVLDPEWVERSLTTHGKMRTRGGPADYGYYWWLYPERTLSEAWGGAGQRIGLLHDAGLVVVMTADIASDIPRSPLAARLYDLFTAAVKSSGPMPADASALAELEGSIADLTAP